MLMLIVRGLSIFAALGTAAPVLSGAMANPDFVVADLVLAAVLILGGLIPGERARTILTIGHAYALGVFSVALAAQVARGGGINPMLLVVMGVCALALVLLAGLKPGRQPVS